MALWLVRIGRAVKIRQRDRLKVVGAKFRSSSRGGRARTRPKVDETPSNKYASPHVETNGSTMNKKVTSSWFEAPCTAAIGATPRGSKVTRARTAEVRRHPYSGPRVYGTKTWVWQRRTSSTSLTSKTTSWSKETATGPGDKQSGLTRVIKAQKRTGNSYSRILASRTLVNRQCLAVIHCGAKSITPRQYRKSKLSCQLS
jgi:hypothetical protein